MITPRDIENAEFKKVALGFSPDEVNDFLDKVIVDFEIIMKENAKLNDKVQNLEEALDYYKKMEETIKGSVILAEKAAVEAKNNANTTAEQIVKEAQLRGNAILQDANKRLYEMNAEITELRNKYVSMKTKMRVLIKGQLEMLDNIEIDDEDDDE